MFEKIPTEFMYGVIALIGGMARYLNDYRNGNPFNIGLFFASTFVSGFSGYMFALMGIAMNFPQPMLFILAGTGGFFGDQSMKLIMQWIGNKMQ